jgi:hypothetical protein
LNSLSKIMGLVLFLLIASPLTVSASQKFLGELQKDAAKRKVEKTTTDVKRLEQKLAGMRQTSFTSPLDAQRYAEEKAKISAQITEMKTVLKHLQTEAGLIDEKNKLISTSTASSIVDLFHPAGTDGAGLAQSVDASFQTFKALFPDASSSFPVTPQIIVYPTKESFAKFEDNKKAASEIRTFLITTKVGVIAEVVEPGNKKHYYVSTYVDEVSHSAVDLLLLRHLFPPHLSGKIEVLSPFLWEGISGAISAMNNPQEYESYKTVLKSQSVTQDGLNALIGAKDWPASDSEYQSFRAEAVLFVYWLKSISEKSNLLSTLLKTPSAQMESVLGNQQMQRNHEREGVREYLTWREKELNPPAAEPVSQTPTEAPAVEGKVPATQ